MLLVFGASHPSLSPSLYLALPSLSSYLHLFGLRCGHCSMMQIRRRSLLHRLEFINPSPHMTRRKRMRRMAKLLSFCNLLRCTCLTDTHTRCLPQPGVSLLQNKLLDKYLTKGCQGLGEVGKPQDVPHSNRIAASEQTLLHCIRGGKHPTPIW